MDEKKIFKLSIRPTWNIVKEVGDNIEKVLKISKRELLESATMAAAELIENAVKYGEPVGNGLESCIEFEARIEDGKIIIRVMNGAMNMRNVNNVIEHIEKIKASGDPFELYTGRLNELLNNPRSGVSQLGLYRIAYEGQFTLDYEYRDNILTITAVR